MTIAIVIFCFEAVASAILRGPSNVAVVAGSNMTMTCEPTAGTSTVDWYHTPVRSKGLIPINYGSTILKNFSEFSVEGKIPGELLSLKITQLKHAGFYQCEATGQKATAQLVVLAFEPQCNFSSRVIKEGTHVNLFCSVSYNSYWAPVMQWRQTTLGNKNGRDIPVNESAMEPLENELTSNLSFLINSSTKGYRYSCKTFFRNSSFTQASKTASNTPKYESIWASPAIETLYGPKNVTVFPLRYIFHPGEVLICSTDSPPSPEFEWTDMETGNVFKGPTIAINVSLVRDEPYNFSCTALNKLTRAYVKSSLFAFAVKHKPAEDESTVTTVNHFGEGSVTALVIFVYTVPIIISIPILLLSLLVVTIRKRRISTVMPSVNIEMEHENQHSIHDNHNGYDSVFPPRFESDVINDNQPGADTRIFERVGADGTVYMEMSKIQPQENLCNPRMPLSQQIFNKSIYASIDHSLSPPPLFSK